MALNGWTSQQREQMASPSTQNGFGALSTQLAFGLHRQAPPDLFFLLFLLLLFCGPIFYKILYMLGGYLELFAHA